MSVKIRRGDIHLIDLKTRLPFKYGIATMTSAPHAFVRVHADVDGTPATGIAADHLPPKWFTKVPDKPLDDEIDEMLRSIEHAVEIAAGLEGATVFDVCRKLFDAQQRWGDEVGDPALLSGFGATLVERALIEAVCKARGESFHQAVRSNSLGIRLEEFDERLRGLQPADLLPDQPRGRVLARHTVGMADPLTDDEISGTERLDDGLPQSLAACIQRYGLQHFKLKVSGDLQHDAERLQRIAAVVTENSVANFAFTMDGNEQFRSLDAFAEFWNAITGNEQLVGFFKYLMFVEQPFHRDVALDAAVLDALANWHDRPTMIIDESDAEWDSLPRALQLGYHGTSHKNCKGVVKGIANACLLAQLRRDAEAGAHVPAYVMSGEDLANIGPVALLQDLAVAATLGVASVERNGHHYFSGLSAFAPEVQSQVLQAHGDLYVLSESGWPTLDVRDGKLNLDSIIAAPFGVGFDLNVEQFVPSADWRASHEM